MKYNVSTFSCRRLTTSAVLTGEITATVGVSGAASSLTSTAEINDKHRDDDIHDNDDYNKEDDND